MILCVLWPSYVILKQSSIQQAVYESQGSLMVTITSHIDSQAAYTPVSWPNSQVHTAASKSSIPQGDVALGSATVTN